MTKGKTKSQKSKAAAASEGDLDWPACQLMLTVTPGPGAVDLLRAAFDHCQPAAVLLRPRPEHHLGAGEAKPLVDLAQQSGVAALIFGDVKLARTLKADGVHFGAQAEGSIQALIADARATLGATANIGADAGISRHRAMEAGEGGADYVAFGAAEDTALSRQARDDLIAWWSEIFEVPCVALDVATAPEAETVDGLGADFVALTVPVGASVGDVVALAGHVDSVLTLGQST